MRKMKYANKLGALNTVIIGSDEIAENKVSIKNMESGETTETALDRIYEFFL